MPCLALQADAETSVTVAGKTMLTAGLSLSACRSCRNGARPNPHHPSGRPDRLGALCVRSCVDHLDRSGRIGNCLEHPFRKRPAWQIDGLGRTSLQEQA